MADSDLRVRAQTTGIARAGQGNQADVPGTLEGAIATADLAYLFSLNGDIFIANGGTASGVVTFAGAYDADGPDFVLDVPINTTVVLLATEVYYEAVGSTLLMETFNSVSTSLAGTCTVTGGAAVVPRNLRTGSSKTSACSASVAVDAAGCTAQTGRIYEFGRHGFQLAEDMAATEPGWPEKKYSWSAKQEGFYPILDGESSLFIHAAAQASLGFITVVYYEVDTKNI